MEEHQQQKQHHPIVTPQIYTRVCDTDGYRGTILYLGTVASASAKNADEIYAGIVWDDAVNRGKHDGSAICRVTGKRIQYFHYPKARPSFVAPYISDDTTGCSFVKLKQKSQSKQQIDFGVALDDSLLSSKYVRIDDPHLVAPDNIITGAAVRTSSGRTKPIELVGELKIRARQQLERLEEVSLRNNRISSISIDPPTQFSHLRGIDLSGNLLSNWHSVELLLEQFPLLEELQLTSNLLRDITTDHSSLVANVNAKLLTTEKTQKKCKIYPNLRRLVLNRCGISSFRTLQIWSHYFPNLEELCAAENDFSNLHTEASSLVDQYINGNDSEISIPLFNTNARPMDGFEKVSLLDLSDCCIPTWSHIERLRSLACLQSLVINENGICSIQQSESCKSQLFHQEQEAIYFPALRALHIVGNRITEWTDVESITTNLPSVTSLRFRNNPLSKDMGQSEFRSLTIARLPNIDFLNASPVSEKERVEAERRYIRVIGRTLNLRDSNKECSHNSNHPRLEELIKKHKDSMVGLSPDGSENTNLASDTINVTITCMAVSGCTMPALHKRLPCSLRVNRLKNMCARAFQVEYDRIILHFREKKSNDTLPSELDDDESPLSYYGILDGCEILVNEADKSIMYTTNNTNRMDIDRQIAEQERTGNVLQNAIRKEMSTQIS